MGCPQSTDTIESVSILHAKGKASDEEGKLEGYWNWKNIEIPWKDPFRKV